MQIKGRNGQQKPERWYCSLPLSGREYCLQRMKGADVGMESGVATFYILRHAQAAASWLTEEWN